MFIFRLISKSIITFAFAKIMQTSAMKACFQIAECSLSYTKINIKVDFCKDFKLNFIFMYIFL